MTEKASERESLVGIVRRFEEAFHHFEGLVRLNIDLEERFDSDGNSIYNAWLYPVDETARNAFTRPAPYHLQLIKEELPASVMNRSHCFRVDSPVAGNRRITLLDEEVLSR